MAWVSVSNGSLPVLAELQFNGSSQQRPSGIHDPQRSIASFLSAVLTLPTWTQFIYSILVSILLDPIIQAVYNLKFHPLSTYPGPLTHAISRFPWIISLQRGTLHQHLHTLHQRYGPIVRIAPNELSYIAPQAWKDIYLNPRIARPAIWFRGEPGESGSIMSASEELHSTYRRAFSGGVTDKAMREHGVVLERYMEILIGKFRALCDGVGGKAEVDIVDWLNFLTFDVSGELSFGASFGSTEDGKAHPWVEISTKFGKGVALAASLSFLPFWVKGLMKYVVPKEVRVKMEYHKQLTVQKVKERMEMGGDKKDFVQSVIEYNEDQGVKDKGKEVSMGEINMNMPVLVFAASETTSSALASTLWYLLRSPEWLSRVQREVRDALDSEEDVKASHPADLEVLTAVINEGLRLGPPSVIGVPRQVGPGGETICGKFVPAGTLLAISQYPAFRSSLNFKDPDTFDPSRFLSASQDSYSIFHPFLIGRHICLGQKFAWMEMRLILARLLYSFDMSLASGPGGGKGLKDWGQQKTFIFWEKEKFYVQLKLRGD